MTDRGDDHERKVNRPRKTARPFNVGVFLIMLEPTLLPIGTSDLIHPLPTLDDTPERACGVRLLG
jgi:hypothetical protein